jgi:transcriptional regulator with XRE-family HTH domain
VSDGHCAAVALRSARKRAGLTQAALGARAGVSQALVSAYENGHRQPTLPTLARLVRAAGFDIRIQLAPLGMRPLGEDGDGALT